MKTDPDDKKADSPAFATAVHPSWHSALFPLADQIAELGEMLREENRLGNGYLPAGENVLRAFKHPFDQVKVLIVGQDPYPTPGHAMGLAFSVAPGVAPPASLRNIYLELADDIGPVDSSNGDLSAWADQGVCLLNRVLTVSPGSPGSHRRRGWETVTEAAIAALIARKKPLVSILWGADAQKLKPILGDTPSISSPHPSPLSAYRGFFGSKPFSRANQLLVEQGETPVDWTALS